MNLKTFSTIKIGGEVECLLRLRDLQVGKLSTYPKPIRFLGNGSNVLMDDQGLKGTVIVGRDTDFIEPRIIQETDSILQLEVSAGLFLPRFSKWSSSQGLTGAEYMVGVPGTMGGATAQNAEANGQAISDIFVSAKGLEWNSERYQDFYFNKNDCHFSYRHSIFKDREELLIQSIVLELQKSDPKTVEARLKKNFTYRKEKTPYFKPSLGSIFTRLPHPSGEGWLYPGKLIEEAGLKGRRIGGAEVSSVHANYIVNEDQASFEDVYALIQEVERVVKEKTSVSLVREIEIWSDRLENLS